LTGLSICRVAVPEIEARQDRALRQGRIRNSSPEGRHRAHRAVRTRRAIIHRLERRPLVL